MRKIAKMAAGLAVALGVAGASANAALVSVSGPNSSAGVAPTILAAPPADLLNGNVTNTGVQGFDEQQGVLLAAPLAVDGGTIAAGTYVDSHMIFLNKPGNLGGLLSHENVEWEFSGEILGVMIDVNGLDEAASTAILGALGTNYDTFNNRGLEGADFVIIDGVTLTTNFFVTQPGDWIRVVTASEVPIPAALPLFLAGIAGLGFVNRRKSKA